MSLLAWLRMPTPARRWPWLAAGELAVELDQEIGRSIHAPSTRISLTFRPHPCAVAALP